MKFPTKIRCIRLTDQIAREGDDEYIAVGGIYTMGNYEGESGHRITIVEGRHNGMGGWFYQASDFEFIKDIKLNKNIKVL